MATSIFVFLIASYFTVFVMFCPFLLLFFWFFFVIMAVLGMNNETQKYRNYPYIVKEILPVVTHV